MTLRVVDVLVLVQRLLGGLQAHPLAHTALTLGTVRVLLLNAQLILTQKLPVLVIKYFFIYNTYQQS